MGDRCTSCRYNVGLNPSVIGKVTCNDKKFLASLAPGPSVMSKQSSAKRASVPPTAKGMAFRRAAKRKQDEESENSIVFSTMPGSADKTAVKPARFHEASMRAKPQAPSPMDRDLVQKDFKKKDKLVDGHEKNRAETTLVKEPRPKKAKFEQQRKPVTTKAAASTEPAVQSEAKAHSSSKASERSASVPAMNLPNGLRIVAGSYERFLYGLVGHLQSSSSGYAVKIEPQFVFPAHVSSIRSVACAGRDSKWLVTGGTDETIKVWDLRRRKEVGALTGHEGTITALSFPSRTFLLSTSEDGTINLYRTRDWALLRTLRGHTGRINSACAHPSGRVALSVGADRTIRMWDLLRGVGSASVKIGVEADRIAWDTQGKRFAVLAGRQVMVFATDMTKLAEVEQDKRLHDMTFTRASIEGEEHELMFVASEAGIVHVYDLDVLEEVEDGAAPTEAARLTGHSNRVRSAQPTLVRADDGSEHVLVTTISSDGFIRVFDMQVGVFDNEALAMYDTKRSRLTCLSVAGYDEGGDMADEVAEDEDDDADTFDTTVDVEDEDEDEELTRLEDEVRRARAAGIIIEGMDELNDDEDDEEEGEDEDEAEGEDEEEEGEDEAED